MSGEMTPQDLLTHFGIKTMFKSTIKPLVRTLTIVRDGNAGKDAPLLRAYRLLDQMEHPYRVTDIERDKDTWTITYKIPVGGRYA